MAKFEREQDKQEELRKKLSPPSLVPEVHITICKPAKWVMTVERNAEGEITTIVAEGFGTSTAPA